MQGCGKTTIVEVLEAVFKHEGLRPASISIDDFYLRFEDQQALAQVRPSGVCCPMQLSVNHAADWKHSASDTGNLQPIPLTLARLTDRLQARQLGWEVDIEGKL